MNRVLVFPVEMLVLITEVYVHFHDYLIRFIFTKDHSRFTPLFHNDHIHLEFDLMKTSF